MKKSALVLSIISTVLAVFAVLFLMLTPTIMKDNSYFGVGTTNVWTAFTTLVLAPWVSNHQRLIAFSNYATDKVLIVFAVALVVLVLTWLIQLIMMIVRKRGNATFTSIAWLVFGLVGLDIVYIGFVPGYFVENKTVFAFLQESAANGWTKFTGYIPYALGALAFALGLVAIIISIADIARYPGFGVKNKPSRVPDTLAYDEPDSSSYVAAGDKAPTPKSDNSDEMRAVANSELAVAPTGVDVDEPTPVVAPDAEKGSDIKATGYAGPAPTIVQYISYGDGPEGHGPHGKEEKPLTKDEIRKLIAEELKGTPSDEAEPEETSDGKNDVLTSDDLRAIIREELAPVEKDVKEEKEEVEAEAPEVATDENGDTVIPESDILTSDDLRAIIREEIDGGKKKEAVAPATEVAPEAPAPEAEEEGGITTDELRSIIHEELEKTIKPSSTPEAPKAEEVAPAVEGAPEDEEGITTDELRSIIHEELAKNNKAPEDTSEPVVAPAPVQETKTEDKPLTAKDLRALIQEALEEHDNPERRELTEEEARDLIVEQIRSYYVGKDQEAKPAEEEKAPEAKPEEGEAPKEEAAPAPAEEAETTEAMTSDELRSIIHEEIASIPAATVVAPASSGSGVTNEEIRSLLAEELAKFRDEQKASNAEAQAEQEDAHKIEQARAEAQAEQSKAQSEDIQNLKANVMTPEQIREIISEELDKKLSQKTIVEEKPVPAPVKEEVKPVEEKPAPKKKEEVKEEVAPAPAKAVEPAPAPAPVIINVAPIVAPAPKATPKVVPVVAPAPEKEKAKIIRIPFPTRMLKGEKDLKSNYNELKAEALSYGLKSRLSNSGDTFRLHTKTYLKITIAGKGLKIYYALNPKDYVNSPIPVHDAGNKNIYKEIPGVFKVKSALSLKRAKQLIADVCEKDNLEQGKIEPHNYAIELKDYKPQLGADDD